MNASKPFWKTRGGATLIASMATVMLIGYCSIRSDINEDVSETKLVANTSEAISDSLAMARGRAEVDSMERAAKYAALERIDLFKVTDYEGSAPLALSGAEEFEAMAASLRILENSDNAEDKKKAKALRPKLIKLQTSAYPKLRKYWADAGRQKLWEDDIEVKVFGKGYTTLEFVGGTFAANRNISSAQEAIRDAVYKLRFKRVNYKWYSGADEYDYYTIKSPPDTEL